MTWVFLENVNLTHTWHFTSPLPSNSNLIKLIHTCQFPVYYPSRYKGLICQILDFDEPVYQDIKILYYSPIVQGFYFNPLDNISSRKIGLRGYWSPKTTVVWSVEVYYWDSEVSQGWLNLPATDLTELTNLNNQQLTLLNQQSILLNQIDSKSTQIITDINNLTLGTSGGSTGTNNNTSFGNPNLI